MKQVSAYMTITGVLYSIASRIPRDSAVNISIGRYNIMFVILNAYVIGNLF